MSGLRRLAGLLGALLLGLTLMAPGTVAARAVGISTYSYSIARGGVTYSLEYCGNRSVASGSTAITRLVLVVHGDERNACEYAASVAKAASTAAQSSTTLIVAPRFVTAADISSSSARLYWSSSGWKSGDLSQTSPYPRSWRISSYEAVDTLLRSITSGRFPNLHDVVVAGHSAGGQFTNRYAAGARWRATGGLTERFVVANPSSYMYWDDQRFLGGAWRTLTSAERTACPTFDDYKYGLLDRNSFMRTASTDELRTNYSSAEVRYLLGDQDTDPASPSLDTSCAAQLQGRHRYERGQLFFARLPAVLGPTATSRHSLRVVLGIGHDGDAMLNSSEGVLALFR